MDYIEIIKACYRPDSRSYALLTDHGQHVAEKALEAAANVRYLNPDLGFIKEAAFLHDIGICFTDAPSLGCSGDHPYICHGYLGRMFLESRGLFRHALVCERHIGTGLSARDIRKQKLPLPDRDMMPLSIEEQIVCYADNFFSKDGQLPAREKSVMEIIAGLERFGPEKVETFLSWVALFG
ncbi:MAG: phosphohydrolase [Desulfobacterales bacterium]|nr:phosphohydrolase [Desulfobacterales bacterium]MDD4392616.1 phosphohydrolase [Desulfobacterales bacterium]